MELLIIVLLILLNGVFAMSEMAIVSAKKVRLRQWADEGNESARVALDLAENPSNLLSTVQIGITLIGVMAGAFGGASVAAQLSPYIRMVAVLAPYADSIAFGLVIAFTTFLSLIIGELVPKRLALNNPERLAMLIAAPMSILAKIVSPIVKVLSFTTELLLRLLGVKPSTEPAVTEEEFKVLLEEGTAAGVFEEDEQEMVERVFRLGDLHVGMLMIPRTRMVWLDLEDPLEENFKKIVDNPFTTFPVGHGTPDSIRSVIHAEDLLAKALLNEPIDLKSVCRPALFVPDSMSAFQALDKFREKHAHLALVVDEYGGVDGLVTLSDLVEEIVGDMAEVGPPSEQMIITRDDGSWLMSGRLPIDELKEHLEIDYLEEEEEGRFQTLGGFVLNQLGHLPTPSESFEWDGFRFEVMDMDGPRIDKILVSSLPEA